MTLSPRHTKSSRNRLYPLLMLPLVAITGWGAAGPEARADLILVRGQAEPVVGTVLRDDGDRVVIRVPAGSGRTRDETHRRGDLELVVRTVSPERLSTLNPSTPVAYRDYAEELMARRDDPAARGMAIRLFQIAAWLDREQLARSSLLGMIALARSPEEEQKFRAALFLVDPLSQREELGLAVSTLSTAETAAAQELLRAVRLLRTSKGPTARSTVEKLEVSKQLERFSRIMSRAEFNVASGQAVLSPTQLRQAIELELELERVLEPTLSRGSNASSIAWSRELSGKGADSIPALELEHLTEFDPRQSVFRDGKWTAP